MGFRVGQRTIDVSAFLAAQVAEVMAMMATGSLPDLVVRRPMGRHLRVTRYKRPQLNAEGNVFPAPPIQDDRVEVIYPSTWSHQAVIAAHLTQYKEPPHE